jgi:hypothetical protein
MKIVNHHFAENHANPADNENIPNDDRDEGDMAANNDNIDEFYDQDENGDDDDIYDAPNSGFTFIMISFKLYSLILVI